jgi:hypothetical protein
MLSKLSRQEREARYRRKMTELQARWRNPVDDDWDFIKAWDDEPKNGSWSSV